MCTVVVKEPIDSYYNVYHSDSVSDSVTGLENLMTIYSNFMDPCKREDTVVVHTFPCELAAITFVM